MVLALLTRRVRSWLLLTLLLPVVGRVLQAVGGRVEQRAPRAGRALGSAGAYARGPGRRGSRARR